MRKQKEEKLKGINQLYDNNSKLAVVGATLKMLYQKY